MKTDRFLIKLRLTITTNYLWIDLDNNIQNNCLPTHRSQKKPQQKLYLNSLSHLRLYKQQCGSALSINAATWLANLHTVTQFNAVRPDCRRSRRPEINKFHVYLEFDFLHFYKSSFAIIAANTNYTVGQKNCTLYFYRATSMHSADYAVARCLSVRPSVCLSVTRRYCV